MSEPGRSDFDERVVWISGAASGMGARFARRFSDLGARVGCIDADPRVVGAAAAIARAGPRAHGVVADVTDPAAIEAAASELEGKLGPAEIVVLSAGVAATSTPIAQLDVAEWKNVLAVNLTGLFLTMRTSIPQLRQADRGVIVVIASAAGLGAGPGYAAYYASKHGAIGLMRTAANELAADGIRVNAVCPGWVDTPMFETQADELGWDRGEAAETFTGEQLFRRLIEPDEIADAVIWLASPGADMVTGIALPVDGGLLAARFSS